MLVNTCRLLATSRSVSARAASRATCSTRRRSCFRVRRSKRVKRRETPATARQRAAVGGEGVWVGGELCEIAVGAAGWEGRFGGALRGTRPGLKTRKLSTKALVGYTWVGGGSARVGGGNEGQSGPVPGGSSARPLLSRWLSPCAPRPPGGRQGGSGGCASPCPRTVRGSSAPGCGSPFPRCSLGCPGDALGRRSPAQAPLHGRRTRGGGYPSVSLGGHGAAGRKPPGGNRRKRNTRRSRGCGRCRSGRGGRSSAAGWR